MDGRDLKFRDATFDAGFTNFGIFFLPDLVKGGAELYRTLKPGREGGNSARDVWATGGVVAVRARGAEDCQAGECAVLDAGAGGVDAEGGAGGDVAGRGVPACGDWGEGRRCLDARMRRMWCGF